MIKHRLAIFASGGGSNAERIMSYFQHHAEVDVAVVISNKPDAPVLAIAKQFGVNTKVFDNSDFVSGEKVLVFCREHAVSFIVLAGFLRKIPSCLIQEFPLRIVNIHPAILPDFGGKGMFGDHVHKAVLDSKLDRSGITIHLVNEHYDEGGFLCQAFTDITYGDSVDSLKKKVQVLEHAYYPFVIDNYLKSLS